MARKKESPSADPHGMFSGMAVLLVGEGVQARRLQIWKQKLMQMGASIEDHFSRKVTHVFAMDSISLLKELDREKLIRYKTKVLLYQWLESSLREGKTVPEDLYVITTESGRGKIQNLSAEHRSCSDEQIPKKSRIFSEGANVASPERNTDTEYYSGSSCDSDNTSHFPGPEITSEVALSHHDNVDINAESSFLYKPPDLNKNVTEIFGKLVSIYSALGDDRRSFSYNKAISVIEKLPFKIVNVDQVKHLPSIGKSMQDHIMEIVNTKKLAKLENFEKDEKVQTINLFGEVWGIGPVTAIKLYEKGHRTLDDLKNEESLANSQKLGLKYFQDIKTRIPRQEIEEMEQLLQKAGEEILPGVMILCGGSYRRGKASCGDMDIVITHSDGKSHIGFLTKYVKHLKDINFLREDLVFSVHSEEGTDSGVDTYFGLCTYPGRELRHRIDFKVYPRDIYAFGLIAWTGNDVLNRRLRSLAETKGFRLDDTGLFPVSQSSHRKRGTKGASLKFDTEKQVFDFLGFPWLEPHQRNL